MCFQGLSSLLLISPKKRKIEWPFSLIERLSIMIEENIRFLKDMVGNRRDLYSILSFLSETIDTMRTDLIGRTGPDAVYAHLTALLAELDAIDRELRDVKG